MDGKVVNATKKCVVDVILLLIVGTPIVVFKWGVTPFHRGFFCDDESISHPYKPNTISTVVLSVVGIGLPTIVILVCELVIYRRNIQSRQLQIQERKDNRYQAFKWLVHPYVVEVYIALGAFLTGVAICQSTTDLMKYSIGRLRPHFLDVCKPNWTMIECQNEQGFMRYIEEDVCTGDEEKIREARLSHPSGHASLSMFTMLYLSFYLQSKLRWRGSKLLRHFLQFVVIYMAIYCCMSRISDYYHHWSDVLGGALLGSIVAIVVVLYVSELFKKPAMSLIANKLSDLHDNYGNISNGARYQIQQDESTNNGRESYTMENA